MIAAAEQDRRQRIVEALSNRRLDRIEGMGRIQERIRDHHQFFQGAVSPEYLQEFLEFSPVDAGNRDNRAFRFDSRPYQTWEQLMSVQTLGKRLRSQSATAISIHEKLTSYVVDRGHTYTVSARKGETADESEIRSAQRAIDNVLSDHCWPEVQEDALNDWTASGDVIRRFDQVAGRLDFISYASWELKPPARDNVGPTRYQLLDGSPIDIARSSTTDCCCYRGQTIR